MAFLSCPSKNSPEYKELVSKLGEWGAFRAWYNANGDISEALVEPREFQGNDYLNLQKISIRPIEYNYNSKEDIIAKLQDKGVINKSKFKGDYYINKTSSSNLNVKGLLTYVDNFQRNLDTIQQLNEDFYNAKGTYLFELIPTQNSMKLTVSSEGLAQINREFTENVSIPAKKLLKQLFNRTGINYEVDNTLPFSGLFKNGKVIINPTHSNFGADTVWHEALGHPIVEAIFQKGNNKALWLGLTSQIDQNQNIIDLINKNYPELIPNSDEWYKEAITTLLGIKLSDGKAFLDKMSIGEKLANLINRFFSKVAEFLNSYFTNKDKVIKVEDLVDKPLTFSELATLLLGENKVDLSDTEFKGTYFQKTLTKEQSDSIVKIRALEDKYTELVNSGEYYKTPTKAIGSTFNAPEVEGDQIYKVFQEFGTSLHSVMEKAIRGDSFSTIISTIPEVENSFASRAQITDIIFDLVGIVRSLNTSGAHVLTESKLTAITRDGIPIIGKSDIIVIRQDGSVDIIDLKTKKVKDVDNIISSIRGWDNKINKENSPLVEPEFTAPNYKRNAEQAWILQLSIYSAMLKQNGIKVNSLNVLPFAYSSYEQKEGDEIIKRSLNNYRVHDPISYKENKFGKTFVGYMEEEKKEKESKKELYNITDEQREETLKNTKELFKGKIKDLSRKIKETKSDKEENILIQQREELRKALNTLDSINDNDYKILHTIGYVRSFLVNATRYAETATGEHIDNLNKLKFVAEAAEHMDTLLNSVDKILITNGITNSEMQNLIKDARNSIEGLKQRQNIAGQISVANITLDYFTLEKRAVLAKAKEEPLKKIKDLENSIANIEGQKGFALDPRNWKLRLNGLRTDIIALKAVADNIPTTDEQIADFVQNNIPGSTMNLNNIIAGASTSDPLLASILDKLSGAARRAKQITLENLQRLGAEKVLNKFIQGKSRSIASDPIREVSNKITYDKDGKEISTPTAVLLRPYIDAYEQDIKRMEYKVYSLQKKLKEAPNEEKEAIRQEYYNALKEQSTWIENNQQLKYIPEYYKLRSILNSDARAWFDDWTKRREEYLTTFNLDENNRVVWSQDDLDTLHSFNQEYQQAMSLTDKNGNIKQQGTQEYSIYLSLLEYSEASNRIYDNIYNESAYNVAYTKAEETYKDDEEGFNRWLRSNTRIINTEEFWTEYNSLNEAIENLVGKKPDITTSIEGEVMTIGDINQRIKDIKKGKSDINGVIDGSLFTKGQIDRLDNLESARDEVYEVLKKGGNIRASLTDQEFTKFLDLTTKKKAMAGNEITDVYTRTYGDYVRDYNVHIEALDNGEITSAEFEIFENNFKEWFNLNHTNPFVSYFSKKGTKLENTPLEATPKSIWRQWGPIDKAKYTKRIGNNKFYYKKIKESAKNTNYQEFIDGTPVPNFININNKGEFEITKKSSYLNSRYEALTKTKDFEGYNWLKDLFFNSQTGTSKNYLGFSLPGYYKKDMDAIMQQGLIDGSTTIAKEKWDRYFKPQSLSDEEQGYLTGKPSTQFKHNKPLPLDRQSLDVIGTILRHSAEANMNKEMNKVGTEVESTIKYYKNKAAELSTSTNAVDQSNSKAISKWVTQADFEFNKLVNGITREYNEHDKRLDKVLDSFTGLSALTKMAYNIPSQVVNVLSGNVQNAIIATGEFFDTKELLQANSIYFKDMLPALFKDEGKFSDKSLLTQLWEFYNPMQKSIDPWLDVAYGGDARRFWEAGPSMVLKDKGENQIAATAWLAMMLKEKVTTTDNKVMSLFDAYELDSEGVLKVRSDVNFTEKQTNNFTSKVAGVIRRSQGNFAAIDQTALEKFSYGRMLFFFKKWFIPMFRNRFKNTNVEYDVEQVMSGFYRTLYHCLANIGVRETFKALIGKQSSLTIAQRADSIKAVREHLIGLSLLMIGYMLKAAHDDDEDNWGYAMGAYLAMRTSNETLQYDPLPFIGGADQYIQTFNSLSIGVSTLTQITGALKNTLALGAAELFPEWEGAQQSAFYQQDTWIFDEGDARVTKQLYQLTGLNNIMNLLYPENALSFTFKNK